MNRNIETIFFAPRAEPVTWPLADVYNNPRGWLVKCDLAGVRREDVHVAAAGHRLTISGVRRDWLVAEGQQAYSLEINYSRFMRTIELPCELTDANIEIDYRDGMLLIEITGC